MDLRSFIENENIQIHIIPFLSYVYYSAHMFFNFCIYMYLLLLSLFPTFLSFFFSSLCCLLLSYCLAPVNTYMYIYFAILNITKSVSMVIALFLFLPISILFALIDCIT